MENVGIIMVAIVAGLALGVLVTWSALSARLAATRTERDAARTRAEELVADRQTLVREFQVLSHESLSRQNERADALAHDGLEATAALLTPVKESLDRFNQRLIAVEKERVAMSVELKHQVIDVRRTGDELRRETAALATALRKPQVRGAWGELQLKRVVEIAGMVEHCDFALQQSGSTAEGRAIRPDMTVHLGDGKFVYVDSKVPLANFLDAAEARDEQEQAERLAAFARNVKGHVEQLSSKNYFTADTSTPEFVVLFLPSEALAAEALSQLPDLHEFAARRNIVLATPSTLIAMLRAVAYAWRQAALADSAAEVFALGRELYQRLGVLGGHLDKMGRSLTASVKAYNETVGSLETRVLVTARRFRDLNVTDADLQPPEPTAATPRVVTAPELLEPDAAQLSPAEREALVRGVPTVDDLIGDPSVSPRLEQGRMAQ